MADAAAFAVPDPPLGEDIVAAVVPRHGMTTMAREMRAFLLDRLAPSRAPRRIWFVDTLPHTPSGKVRQGELTRRWSVQRD